MNWNAITQAIRLIKSNKLTSFINIFGLGIGLGCTILMATYIIHEFSFDSYHKNSDKIFRVVIEKDCSIPYAMGETIGSEISGFEKIFRIYSIWNTHIKSGEVYIKEDDFILADQEIFSVLDIPIVMGKAQNLLQNPASLVISDRVAHKYFGNENPLGNSLEVNVSGRKVNFTITGVFKRFPSYSSIQADWIGNIAEAFPIMTNASDIFGKLSEEDAINIQQNWDKGGFQTFALTSDKINIKEASLKCTAIYQSHKPNDKREVYLQPFKQMYLHSENVYNTSPIKTSQLDTINIYAGIASLILLIACINYILLSIADAKKQLKEVACRKVNGASSFQIQKKFLFQSVFISFLSLIPALIFVSLIIPFFNQLYDKNLSMQLFLELPYLLMLAAFILITGLLAGAYISFYASRLNPLSLLSPVSVKGKSSGVGKGIMIAVQFLVFIFLFISTLVMEKQLLFSKNGNPGFDVSNVLIFRLDNKEAQNHFSAIKSLVEKNPHVINVAGSHTTPPTQSFMQLTVDNGDRGKIDEEGLFVCDGLISLLKIPVIDGYDYSPEEPQNKTGDFLIINQSAAKKYNVRAGESLSGFSVRAIVADFHAHSLHRFVKPLMLLHVDDKDATELVVRTDGNNKQVIDDLNTIWKDMAPSTFLEYELLSDRIASFYEKEEKQAKSVVFFTFMAIFLSIMGLFGYVSLVLIQRTKEIGIRKVNGARISEVLIMLNRDFVKWVAIAFVIATPIAHYAMNKWLEGFAYKTELSWWIFALAGVIALGIALLTVSYQSYKAAVKNPIERLRYE